MPKFTIGAAQTRRDIERCFRLWGVTEYTLSVEKNSDDGEAWVRFMLGTERKTLSCVAFDQYFANLRSLYLTLDALRIAADRGILDQFRQFFMELPAPGETAYFDPWAELGLVEGTSLETAEIVYKSKARSLHPDTGTGDNDAMVRLNRAIEELRKVAK